MVLDWITNNWLEIFGVVSGIIYVILEIKQNLWLWPLGIVTSAVYIIVFFSSKFYADMSLQVYYLAISCLGLYWWMRKGNGKKREEETKRVGEGEKGELKVTRVKFRTGVVLAIAFALLFIIMWFVLSKFTDSPVPECDSFITSLSIVATWMLARKIFEHWYLWIIVNSVSIILFVIKGLYPTVILYIIYFAMSFAGLKEWRRYLL